MSLTVQQLTDDGTFLWTFSPPFAPAKHRFKFPGSFTILIDPWLEGHTTIYHPRFATTQHTAPPAITSLAEISDQLDLIVISHDQADHLHRETLCTLPKHTRTTIVAPPKAAKTILEWQHFTYPEIVKVLKPYCGRKMGGIVHIPIGPYSSASAEGEVTIANIPQKGDLIGLHNGIAITYCPPGSLLTAPDGTTVNIADMPMMSASRPATGNSSKSPYSSKSSRQRYLKGALDDVDWVRPNDEKPTNDEDDYDATQPRPVRSPTDSARRPSTSRSLPPSSRSTGKRRNNFEKVLSVIYSPHGIDPASLEPYITGHLSALGNALPVTALFHSLTYESNPWWMGGVVCAGAPGGIKIAQKLGVRYWLGAHDEVKESDGLATKWITSRRYDVEEVTKMLREADGLGKGTGIGTEIVMLKAGQTRRLVA